MTTGLVWEERLMWHDTGALAAHLPPGGFIEPDTSAESPATKRRIHNLIVVSGLADQLQRIPARPATDAELLAVHSRGYLERLAAMSAGTGGDAGDGAPFTRGSYEIARLAAGGAIEATAAVMVGEVTNAYALIRPPGHHAEADRGRGFCLLANGALAVKGALKAGAERIAVVDWDVHHGNGTQAAFWDEPRVLTVSLHQDRNFPSDSGHASERGGPDAPGSNLNIPLPPGSGIGAYQVAFDRLVLPAVRRHAPDLLLIACGLDACALDPYGRMLLTSEDFRLLTGELNAVAAELCGGRIVGVHEGGYSSAYAPFCALAVIEELAGVRTGVADPFLAELSLLGQRDLQPHQLQVIEEISRQIGP